MPPSAAVSPHVGRAGEALDDTSAIRALRQSDCTSRRVRTNLDRAELLALAQRVVPTYPGRAPDVQTMTPDFRIVIARQLAAPARAARQDLAREDLTAEHLTSTRTQASVAVSAAADRGATAEVSLAART